MDRLEDLMPLDRSTLLALWLPGATGPDAVTRAVDAVQGDDEPHTVAGAPDLVPDGSGLAALVTAWARAEHVAAVIPVPGDVTGVPAEVAAAALDAGECLLVHADGRSWAAVPEVVVFGTDLEPGHLVTWTVTAVPSWHERLPGIVGTLPEAETALRQALRQATEALAGLDVARWRPDAAEAVLALASEADPGWPLPGDLPSRLVHVLVRSARLRAIVAVATVDDGGAVNLWQADQRTAALRHVDHAARRAVVAATAHGRR